MSAKRIAVLGLFRSGSTAVAGVLHHLGVDMGAPFFGGYYESEWLSKQLRRWWDEPRLQEKVAQTERVRVLAKWVRDREKAGARWVGMKHPLLSLCGEDLLEAWGKETAFIRCCRPRRESIESLGQMGGDCDSEFVQTTLMNALDRFFGDQEHFQISFADMMQSPGAKIQQMIDYLEIKPEPEKIASAIQFVEPGSKAKVEAERQKARQSKKGQKLRRFLSAWG